MGIRYVGADYLVALVAGQSHLSPFGQTFHKGNHLLVYTAFKDYLSGSRIHYHRSVMGNDESALTVHAKCFGQGQYAVCGSARSQGNAYSQLLHLDERGYGALGKFSLAVK